ncbi:MAG: SpoIIE family protein phosphatase [Candidatus Korobacteraceae bacterium]
MTDSIEPSRILIAEDQEHVREALAMLLRSRGYAVLMSSSPQEALQSAGQQTVDLALVDMNYRRDSTSGVEGLDLIESLRQLDHTLPVVALTAWGNVDLAVSAMKSGAADFIEKPWRNDSLLEKVESLTRRGREVRSMQRVADYEKQDAQQVQMRIVPPRHIVAGDIELFGESVPKGDVGGDYFGAWQPSPETLHFCVADVSGKGTPGALIAAMLHASVSSLAASDGGAEKIVNEVEHILRDQLGKEHYVTLFYGVLDVASRTLEYVNAGHCPPVVLRANGTMELLGPTRPVLGLVKHEAAPAERVVLRSGDSLALYTDGITEAADSDGAEFGQERLLETLRREGGANLQHLHARVLGGVREYASGNLADDATLVLLSVRGATPARVASTDDRALSQTQG